MKEQLIEKSNIVDSHELTELGINESSYLLCVKDNKLHKVEIDNVENKIFKQFYIHLSDNFIDNLKIQDYVETVDKLPTNASLGSIYMVGPDSKGKYRLHVNSSTGWIDHGEFAGLSVGVVQKLGQSITEVPSQKLLSDELENIYNSVQVITEEEYNKLEIKDPSIFYFTYEED